MQSKGVPYGIDYIDPWVRDISGRRDWRHMLSNALAKLLEPIAIKKASLITGVSEDYYRAALLRNFKPYQINPAFGQSLQVPDPTDLTSNNSKIHHIAFPYGFDPSDHEIILENLEYPWNDIPNCSPWVYAGSFLPKSRFFVQHLFESIRDLVRDGKWRENHHLFFLGTGNYSGKSIMDYAREVGIDRYVHEYRDRYPFLHVLNFLSASFGVMVVGSTEKHYTASKVYQSVLSKRPVIAVLHTGSSAHQVLRTIKADTFLVGWEEDLRVDCFKKRLNETISDFIDSPESWNPDYSILREKYSSRVFTERLIRGIEALTV